MLRDAHATGEGYLRSPRDGSLQDIVERILTLERDAGVCPDRRLGVSLGFHLFARQAGDAAAWGGEWIETRPSGPQGWWPADACTGALFGHLRHIGLAWACIGASAGEHVARLVAAARDEGLGIALRPAPDTLEVVEDSDPGGMTLESLPVLLDALIARRAGRPAARGESEVLRGLADIVAGCAPCPVLAAASRKHFVNGLHPEADGDAVKASVAFALDALRLGARIFRVHDVLESCTALSHALQ